MIKDQDIKIVKLSNGLTLITEQMDNTYSFSIGIWLKEGSRDEEENLMGITHFTEHMFFKGTKNKSVLEIAKIIDTLGGNVDAFTSKETLCVYGSFLSEHLDIVAELFSDLIINPIFDAQEMEKERNVIIEEIKSIEDSPAELLFDYFTKKIWLNHPLGRPISGDINSISKITSENIKEFFLNKFVPDNLIITIAGGINHNEAYKVCEKYFSSLQVEKKVENKRFPAHNQSFIEFFDKSQLEQVHICIGTYGYPANNEKRYAYYLFNTILGGSMSSRLFQRIREQEGMAYTVQSLINSYLDSGFTAIYLATSKENIKKAIDLVSEEIKKLKKEYISEAELQRAKEHIKGNLLLGLELSSNRMINLAKQHLYFNRFIPIKETIDAINSVSIEEINLLANELFQKKYLAIAVLGNINNFRINIDEIDWD